MNLNPSLPPYGAIVQQQKSGGINANFNTNYGLPGSVYWFPHDLIGMNAEDNNLQFGFILTFYQYSRPSIYAAGNLGNQLGSIILPLPNELIDKQTIKYDEQNLTPVVGAILNEEKAAESTQGTQTWWQSFLNDLPSAFVKGGIGALLQTGSSGLNNLFKVVGQQNATKIGLQMAGLAINPFLTVLFEYPVFKRYTFTWTFVPENAADSQKLDFILKKLRYHSLPDYSQVVSGNLLLTYPDIMIPLLVPGPYQFYFKKCVIENISINYAPGDTPAFHANSYAPVAIQLNMSILEIEMWTKDDVINQPNDVYSNINNNTQLNPQGISTVTSFN